MRCHGGANGGAVVGHTSEDGRMGLRKTWGRFKAVVLKMLFMAHSVLLLVTLPLPLPHGHLLLLGSAPLCITKHQALLLPEAPPVSGATTSG